MKICRSIVAVALAAPLALAVWAGAIPGTGAEARAETQGIVAIANDQPITERDITQRIALRKILGDMPSGGLTRQQALQDLIDDQVKNVEAARFMLVPTDAEITDRMNRIAKGKKISRDELLAQLKAQGISETTFRRYLQASISFSRIIAGKYREDVTVTPAEVDARMAEINNTIGAQMRKIMNDPRMKPLTVYSLMEITLPLDGEDPMLVQSRAIEAQQVLRKFNGCGKARSATEGIFNVKVGKKFDADGSKLPKPMKEALDKAGQGRAIGPMRGKDSIQLIALCGVRTITPPKPDFKMPTREQIERMVLEDKYGKIEEDYLKEARSKVYVEYRNPSYAGQ
jgi:peptidyl-prolyl cis-trans isomerase SurA